MKFQLIKGPAAFIGYLYLANNRLTALTNLLMIFSFIPVVIFVYLVKGYIPM
ncbi:hypothetical protein [Peribacillus butanolivorans]|uniref:hypothetical protein n=1 Tax=Peribacillus butanolivorans TaxID=421767 RepID=UPI0015968C2D|nr:hypothetical protein [Peribacillus butanolivorans]